MQTSTPVLPPSSRFPQFVCVHNSVKVHNIQSAHTHTHAHTLSVKSHVVVMQCMLLHTSLPASTHAITTCRRSVSRCVCVLNMHQVQNMQHCWLQPSASRDIVSIIKNKKKCKKEKKKKLQNHSIINMKWAVQ